MFSRYIEGIGLLFNRTGAWGKEKMKVVEFVYNRDGK